jgi:hypothetical protein
MLKSGLHSEGSEEWGGGRAGSFRQAHVNEICLAH